MCFAMTVTVKFLILDNSNAVVRPMTPALKTSLSIFTRTFALITYPKTTILVSDIIYFSLYDVGKVYFEGKSGIYAQA